LGNAGIEAVLYLALAADGERKQQKKGITIVLYCARGFFLLLLHTTTPFLWQICIICFTHRLSCSRSAGYSCAERAQRGSRIRSFMYDCLAQRTHCSSCSSSPYHATMYNQEGLRETARVVTHVFSLLLISHPYFLPLAIRNRP
jgi:hypothetical protein